MGHGREMPADRNSTGVPMRATRKSGLISILAIGLLAGSAFGVTAQDEEAADASLEASAFRVVVQIDDAELSVDPETGVETVVGVGVEASDPRASGTLSAATATGGVGDEVPSYRLRKSGIRIPGSTFRW